MKNICFFNHFHNGDIFHGKAFLKELSESIDTNFSYAHLNDPKVVLDINIPHVSMPDIGDRVKFKETEDTLYINTWIGCYFHQGITYDNSTDSECTLKFTYAMYSKIYEEINNVFGTNLKLSSIENYIPTIDFTKFDIQHVDEYVETNKGRKILFSNGPCLSGQCRYYGDMKPIIEPLAKKYPNITFITTSNIDTELKNIESANDIIKIDGCDLNEIAYLSKFCDIIVGRNSGPFCFCTHKENVLNPNISFYAFGDILSTSFLYGIDMECSFMFDFFENFEGVVNSLDNLIKEKN
jgi:hypothetical protein